jgi:hypothetical protein
MFEPIKIMQEDLQKARGPKAFTRAETLSFVKANPQIFNM